VAHLLLPLASRVVLCTAPAKSLSAALASAATAHGSGSGSTPTVGGTLSGISKEVSAERENLPYDPTIPDPLSVARELGLSLLVTLAEADTLGMRWQPVMYARMNASSLWCAYEFMSLRVPLITADGNF